MTALDLGGYKGKTWLQVQHAIVNDDDETGEELIQAYAADLGTRGGRDYFGLNLNSRGWKAGVHAPTLSHLCVLHRKPKCLAAMVACGSNMSMHDAGGSTPLDLAMKLRDRGLIEILHGRTDDLESTKEEIRELAAQRALDFRQQLSADLDGAIEAKDRPEIERLMGVAASYCKREDNKNLLPGGQKAFFTIVGAPKEAGTSPQHDPFREMVQSAHEALEKMDALIKGRTKTIVPLKPFQWPSQVDLPIDQPRYNVAIQISTSSEEATLDMSRHAQAQFGAPTVNSIKEHASRNLSGRSVVAPGEYAEMCVYGW